jgi:hypothetical protein
MVCLAEAAHLVDDQAAARLLADRLEPYAGRLAVHDAGVSAPIDLARTQLALTCGDNERAASIARTAAEASRRANTPIFLGRALVQESAARRELGQPSRAYQGLVDEAATIARRTGAGLITQESIRYGLTN